MAKIYDVVAVTGTYKNRNGEEKKRYLNCGAVFRNDQGNLSMKLEGLPVGGDWNGWLSFFEPRQNVQPPASQVNQGTAPDNGGGALDDSIPFAALHHDA